MRTFLGIAAGLTLASGVALVAASDQQQVVKERRVEQAPPSWTQSGADDLVGQPMVRRLAILQGRGAELGITIKDLDEPQARTTNGVVVDAVAENSAGAKAGIKKGDVVTDFDGERVRSARQLSRLRWPEWSPARTSSSRYRRDTARECSRPIRRGGGSSSTCIRPPTATSCSSAWTVMAAWGSGSRI